MKKFLLALTLVLCLAVSMVALTSCGDGDDCDHIWATKATVDTAATCTTEGSESIKCLDCGDIKEDSVTAIPATGHAYSTDAYTAATCVDAGSKSEICTACGDTVNTTIPATGEHTWSALPTIDVEATCTEPGSKSIKCTVCQATKPDSTEVVPAEHVWGVIATADVLPTCTEPGSKSIKCLFCETKQDGSDEVIPATGHSDVPVVVTPTFFSEGLAQGNCVDCGTTVTETLPKTEVALNTINATHAVNNIPQQTLGIGEALDGKTFAPTAENPNGNDLYLEFSVLMNETMPTIQGSGIGWGHMANNSDVTSEGESCEKLFSWLYYKNGNEWCPFAGGFEFSENVKEFVYGPTWKKNGTADNYTIIQGLDGWHRIGLQYHQNVYRDGDTFTYDVTATVYVDGVKTNEIKLTWGAFFYSAAVVDGEVVYTDNVDVEAYYVVAYRIGNGALAAGNTEDAYFPFADCMLTVGDGFVLDVSPVTNPEAQDFVQDEVTLSGKIYYQINTAE